ncbi:hypothetical protein ABMY11_16960, partial [Vibrio vulnificus]|uniref:hypothetical protein n=1 Tax=Vibrio vulnificus TaxID=672 RepID=UPI004058B050
MLVSDETSIASNGFLYWDATWIQQKAPQSRNVVHLRGAALRLTGYRVFDIFTALGRFGLGRLSIKR